MQKISHVSIVLNVVEFNMLHFETWPLGLKSTHTVFKTFSYLVMFSKCNVRGYLFSCVMP